MENNKLKNWNREETKNEINYEFTEQVGSHTVTARVDNIKYPLIEEGILWKSEIRLNDKDFNILARLGIGFYKTRDKADKRLIRQIEKFKNPEDFRGVFLLSRIRRQLYKQSTSNNKYNKQEE